MATPAEPPAKTLVSEALSVTADPIDGTAATRGSGLLTRPAPTTQAIAREEIDLQSEIKQTHAVLSEFLIGQNVAEELISTENIRPQTVLYLIYWFHRLKNNSLEQERIVDHLLGYMGESVAAPDHFAARILSDESLAAISKRYVEKLLPPVKTVDLVITRAVQTDEYDPEVLCIARKYYPCGSVLPGGLIRDDDGDNPFNLPRQIFAALRVAGEKVLGGTDDLKYAMEKDADGKDCYVVRGATSSPLIRLYPEDRGGYRYRENLKGTLRPADPRHIVDTIGFKCILEGELPGDSHWLRKSEIMSVDKPSGGFAFGHHREIVAFITCQTSVAKERQFKESEFIRGIIDSPLETYRTMARQFSSHGNSPYAPFPQLFPVVDKLKEALFSSKVNERCRNNPILNAFRDKAFIALRHVSIKSQPSTFMPYLPTMRAICEALAFFDVLARDAKGFYDDMPSDGIFEHNPKEKKYASYHMYRYRYRLDKLLSWIPGEIVIPTFEELTARDLLRIRGVPIRFLGLSLDFLYVDEFEQSPEEFLVHDANHSYRMVLEDRKLLAEKGWDQERLITESNAFIVNYLDQIKIRFGDSEEEKAIKKLKEIILFEISHEDARPLLAEVVGYYIQMIGGDSVPFEVPSIDPDTGYMSIVETRDTGISTLSYVRNKLQHGFYDHIDAISPDIVLPKYRTSYWIAKAAYEMLVELQATPSEYAELDEHGNVTLEWLMKRTCSVGPDNIHEASVDDPLVDQYGDGADLLNPKRYQA